MYTVLVVEVCDAFVTILSVLLVPVTVVPLIVLVAEAVTSVVERLTFQLRFIVWVLLSASISNGVTLNVALSGNT